MGTENVRRVLFGLPAILMALSTASPAASATWIVNGASPSCSDSGPGSAAKPLCTIGQGASRAVPGDTVLVQAGTYREEISPAASGVSGAPITFEAAGPGVLVLGTRDVSDPADWSKTSSAAWMRSYASSSPPAQVFLDGARLVAAPDLAGMTSGSFHYDPSLARLYVDIGGENPGVGHRIEAGARAFGFLLSGKAHIVVDGFEILYQNRTGIRAGACSAIALRNSRISGTGVYGIEVDGCTGPVLVEGNDVSLSATEGLRIQSSNGTTVRGNASHHNISHGIGVRSASASLIVDNTVHSNRDPEMRRTSGLDLSVGSTDNLVQGNTAYGNDDSGIDVYGASHRNILTRNVSFGNGDHGFDVNASEEVSCVSNTAYGNADSGFNFENAAINARFMNNIAADNGLRTATFNLLVGSSSAPGFFADRNLLWKSAPGDQVRYGGTNYATLALLRQQTGLEAHGLEADPLFRDAASGDLHVLGSSPAVDSADASAPGFTQEDRDGLSPQDVLFVPDTGAGLPTFADRGAYEYDDPGPGEPGADVPLTLARTGSDLTLSWGATAGACAPVEFAVYRGSLLALRSGIYGHDTALVCAAGVSSLRIPLADPRLGASDYFLVVAGDGAEEGSYGRDSRGVERPVSAAACAPAQDLTPCVP